MLQKNTISQKWRVFAFDPTTGLPVTGDAANITAKINKDWAGVTALSSTNPTETESGFYEFDLTQAETNANWLDIYPESSTSGVQVIGVPGGMGTVPLNFQTLAISSNRMAANLSAVGGVTAVVTNMVTMFNDDWTTSYDTVNHRVNTTVVSVGNNAIAAASIASAAITAAKFGSSAITSTVLAANAIGASQIASSAITSAKFASNAITSTVIAADAIGASQLAADAATEIATTVEAAILNEGDATALLAAIAAKVEQFLINDGDASATLAAIATAVTAAIGTGSALTALATQSSVNTVAGYLDTEVAAILAAVDTEVAAIKAKIDNLPSDPADASDIATAFGTVNTTLATIAGYVDTEVAAIKAKTDLIPASPASVGDIPTVSQIWTTALTEAYRTTGQTGTAAQLLYELLANLTEFAISGTTLQTKKIDHSTNGPAYTLNDATNPTGKTRAS